MKRSVWPRADVQAVLRNQRVRHVSWDAAQNAQRVEDWQVQSMPAFFLVETDAQGDVVRIVKQQTGYMDAARTRRFIQWP